jgi:carbonic anhydrase/acetyltransferase-like protein (isoleucine patch superfamily)
MIINCDGHSPSVSDTSFVAPNATLIGRVTLEEQTSIWFGAVLRGDVEDIIVRKGANIQDLAMVHADMGFKADIGEYATVGHHATVHGCTVGAGSLIGINAVVLNGAKIGENSIVGANALVPEGMDIPPYSLVVGSPAKVKRTLSEEQVALVRMGTDHYIKNGERFKALLES